MQLEVGDRQEPGIFLVDQVVPDLAADPHPVLLLPGGSILYGFIFHPLLPQVGFIGPVKG